MLLRQHNVFTMGVFNMCAIESEKAPDRRELRLDSFANKLLNFKSGLDNSNICIGAD
jgi:hypothetical protein